MAITGRGETVKTAPTCDGLRSERRLISGALAAAVPVTVGAAVGLVAYLVGTADLRWLAALAAATVAIAIVAALPNRLRFLWLAFVLSFQFLDPNLRVLYGHAGSDGLVFFLPFLLGLFILVISLASGVFPYQQFRWGGPFAVPIAMLFGISVLSSIPSAEHFTNLIEITAQLQLYVLYLIGLNAVLDEKHLRRVLTVLFMTLALQCLICYGESALKLKYISIMGEYVYGDEITRPGGTLGPNPFYLADFLTPIALILTADFMCLAGKGAFEAWPRGLLISMAAVALGLTLTRSAWVSFAIGCLFVAIIAMRRRILSIRKIVVLGACVLAAAAAAAPLIAERLSRQSFDADYDERFALMKMAVSVVQANPLLGVGPGAYAASYKQYLTADLADKWQYVVHNHYLLRAAETGIPGALAFVLLLVMAVRLALRVSQSSVPLIRTLAIGVAATVVAEMNQMYWEIWTEVGPTELLWFLLGLLGAAETMQTRQVERGGDREVLPRSGPRAA
jgi:O-antigen ligase